MRKIIAYTKENKEVVIKRSIVIGATFLGLMLTAGLLKKDRETPDELLTKEEALSEAGL